MITPNRKHIILAIATLFIIATSVAQNPKIKCYFNHPVNNSLSTGINAVYLNGTFPDTIVSYINNAKYTLDFAIYDFTSVAKDGVSKIATAVNNAYNRGVKIRWINNGSSGNTGMSLLSSSIPRISSPTGGSYGIMHNKFLIVDANSPNADEVYLITGSYNYSVEQTNTDYNNLLIIQDKNVASTYYDQFNQMWGGTDSIPNTTKSVFGTHKVTSTKHYFNVNGTQIDVHFSPKDTCGKYLTAVANSANNDLTAGIYTFTDNSIATAILNKYNNNVSVRVIEDQFSKTYSPYTTLSGPLGNSFVVYTGSGLYHNKIMVVDALLPSSDPQVATGSFNWTNAAETSNDENLIVVHDAAIANQYYQSICNNITVNGGSACVSPLPVDWVSFTASVNSDKGITLHWETSKEVNIKYFEMQHSIDGISYENIGQTKVEATNKYEFTDGKPNAGNNFYRIKEIDEDGGFTFSKVVGVYNRTAATINLYPNPTSTELNVLLPLRASNISFYNSVGKRLMEYDVHLKSSINIDVSRLAKGSYYVVIISDNEKTVKSFEKL